LKGEEAVQTVRDACECLVNDIGGGMYYDSNKVPEGADRNYTYDAAVAQVVYRCFPIDGEAAIREWVGKVMRNVRIAELIENIILEVGVKVRREEWPQNGSEKRYPVIRRDGFKEEKLGPAIQRYADQITKLAADEI
jgi:hypothetical protein